MPKKASKKEMRERELYERELYSKASVVGSIRFVVDEADEESVVLEEYENLSRNLATILTRDKEVVAVRLIPHKDKCEVHIAKNKSWLEIDLVYIDKIREYVKSLSNDAPIYLEDALEREEVKKLFSVVMEYCCDKMNTRFSKLKDDIKKDMFNQHIRSFMDYALIDAENIDDIDGYDLSEKCSSYYYEFKSSTRAPKKFLRHVKKVGSYYTALIDITACACKEKYKRLFSNMHVHKLEPITILQPISSWENIVQGYISDSDSDLDPDPDPDHKKYKEFKKKCLADPYIFTSLISTYGNVDRLGDESIERDIYLHAEMNILTKIIDQKYKGRAFIAVSKRCCYLCELYIRFVNTKGYKIYTSGAHKKLYSKWLLPNIKNINLRIESVNYMIEQLDQIINEEIPKHISIVAVSDSDGVSVKSGTNPNIRKKGDSLMKSRKPKRKT